MYLPKQKDENTMQNPIVQEFKDVFEGLGKLPGVHKIKLKENSVPVTEACRKSPFPLHDQVKAELRRMED